MSGLNLEDRPYTLKELDGLGYNRMRLSRLVRDGLLQSDARGIYRLPFDGANSERASWAARSIALPGSVFCLYSAAVYHGITENLGARTYMGIKGRRRSTAGVEFFTWKDTENFDVGIETLRIGSADVLVTNPARTLIDFFRYSHLGKSDKRMKKPVDPEALNDVVVRYMQKFGKPDINAHQIAKVFGVREELGNFMGILQAVRPDLWLPPHRQET
jgi:predicted transcriptional regulator of viral defense system